MKLGFLAFAELIMISASAGHDGLWGGFFAVLSLGLIGLALVYGTDCVLTWFVAIAGVIMTLFSLRYAVNSLGSVVYSLIGVFLVLGGLFLLRLKRQQDHDEPVY